MGGSYKSLCNCRNASEIGDYVKNKIEYCIQKYMSFEDTVTYLQENEQISHSLTKLIWEQLQRENPEFFKNYYLRCKIASQIKMFNDNLDKQVALMIENGHVNICNTSPAIRDFLLQNPEGVRLMEKLANTYYNRTESFPSLALADTNAPTVMQLPIPNYQQNQVQHYQQSTSNDLAYNNLSDRTHAPAAATDQWPSSYDPAFNYLSDPTHAPAEATDQWLSSYDPACVGAQTVAQAATTREDPYTGHNGLNFQDVGIEAMLQNLDVKHGSTNEMQNGESSNGLQNGESIDQPLWHMFDTDQTMQLCTSIDKQQAQGVIHNHPESEDLNNPDSGDGTLTTAQNQPELQTQEQRQGSRKRGAISERIN